MGTQRNQGWVTSGVQRALLGAATNEIKAAPRPGVLAASRAVSCARLAPGLAGWCRHGCAAGRPRRAVCVGLAGGALHCMRARAELLAQLG